MAREQNTVFYIFLNENNFQSSPKGLIDNKFALIQVIVCRQVTR